MDPLSAGASAITVLGAALGATKVSLQFLKTIKKAPKALRDLIDEVKQIDAILSDVKGACQHGQQCSASLELLLPRAKAKLQDLNELIHSQLVKTKENVEVDRFAFAKHQGKVYGLKEDLRNLRQDITTALSAAILGQAAQANKSASNLRQDLTTALSAATPGQAVQTNKHTLDSYAHVLQGLFQRIEESPKIQQSLTRLEGFRRENTPTKASQSSAFCSSSDDARHSASLSAQRAPNLNSEPTAMLSFYALNNLPASPQARRVPAATMLHGQASKYMGRSCSAACVCPCHKKASFTSPWSAKSFIGSFSVTYNGISVLTSACTIKSCKRSSSPSVRITYVLPTWVANRMLWAWFRSAPIAGPELLLKLRRVVTTDSYTWARVGDLERLRTMFVRGTASVDDVRPQDGMSTLTAAVHFRQIDIVRFLLDSGADADSQDYAGRSARDVARDIVLVLGALHPNARDLSRMLDLGDAYDGSDGFSSLHRIVLGLSDRDLEAELLEHPEIVNATDSIGRSALGWSTIRHLDRYSLLLLKHGADPNLSDRFGFLPIHRCASSGDSSLLRVLLKSGAEGGKKDSAGNSGIHLASWCDSSMNIITLLEAGYDVNARNHFDETPLHWCMMNDQEQAAETLLRNRADIDPVQKNGWCPWQCAINYGSAKVLHVLVQYGCDLTLRFPDSSTVLHLAAYKANEPVVDVLMEADLTGVDADAVDRYGCSADDRLRFCLQDNHYYRRGCSFKLHHSIQQLINKVRAANYHIQNVSHAEELNSEDEVEYSEDDSRGDEQSGDEPVEENESADDENCSYEDAQEDLEADNTLLAPETSTTPAE